MNGEVSAIKQKLEVSSIDVRAAHPPGMDSQDRVMKFVRLQTLSMFFYPLNALKLDRFPAR